MEISTSEINPCTVLGSRYVAWRTKIKTNWKCLNTYNQLLFQDTLSVLLDAVRMDDQEKAFHFKKTHEWATVEEIMAAHGKL